ncbi:MAG: LPP20 family lipoprotein [Treponema sp.]|nr:LPP20 family lipoprotein [Treponema sp.]
MKKLAAALFVLANFSLAFCVQPPLWVDDLQSAYPNQKYIASLGTGNTVDNARSSAIGQIASFFSSKVLVNTSANSNMKSDGSSTSKSQQIDQSVQVVSDMTLTAVKYSSPYYDKKKKLYYVAAYIERQEGWQAIELKAARLKSQYSSAMALAKKAGDTVNKYKYLTRAKDAAKELLSTLYLGFALEPAQKKAYEPLVNEILQNYELETLSSYKIPTCVEASGDYDNMISSKVLEIVKRNGFEPGAKKAACDAVLKIQIDSNEQVDDELHTIAPAVSITLASKDGAKTYYAWQKSWGKTVNFSLEQAQKKAFPKIADEISSAVSADFAEKFLQE